MPSGVNGYRHCRRCDQTKPASAYTNDARGKSRQRCEQCRAEIAELEKRQCTSCGETKRRLAFDSTPSGGLRTRCKRCVAELDAVTPATSTLLEQIVDLQDGDWQSLGACVGLDPEMFHPTQGEPADAALAVCEGCQVRLRCLDHALTRPEPFGVWGGKTAAGRDRMRRNRSRRQRGSAA